MTTINEMKNLALFTIGEPDEIDFTDTTQEIVKKVNRIYDTSKNFVLSNYFWRFAQKRAELDQYIKETDTFTANAGTDIITLATYSPWDTLEITLTTTGTLPAGLSTSTTYYLITSTGLTAQISATSGGSAIDITDTGTGVHTINFTSVYNSPYDYLYKKPTDMLVMRKAYTDNEANSPIRIFELDTVGFHTDSINTSTDSVWIWYIENTDESLFPIYFVDYFKYKLALDLCFNLTGDTDLLQLLAQQEQKMLLSAKNIDAKQVQTRTIQASPFTKIRG